MRHLLYPLVLLALGCSPRLSPTPAADAPVHPPAASEEIPLAPDLRHGVLENGMRYYIWPNHHPENRAVFRLVVEVGSIVEDPDQLGLAHFVEHMAFNGTTNFEGNDLIKYLEKTGTRFGAHLNAHTSFDETVYKLQVPTDDPELFDQAFLILEDWAHGLRFDPDETEAERGVVLEEWRRSLGPGTRMWEAVLPVTMAGSPYPERRPIGTEESLKTFTRDAAVRFYDDWYQPELMALVAVGDFDVDAVEQKIHEHFNRIEAPESPRERPRHDVPDRTEPAWVIFSDPEQTSTVLTIETGHDDVHDRTYGQYRDYLAREAFLGILSERLRDITKEPDAPFRAAFAWRGRRTPTEGTWAVRVQPVEGRAVEAYERVLTELERITRHGVTETELQRAVRRTERDIQTHYDQRHTTESVQRADELVRHVTTGEPVPGMAREWEITLQLLPTLTVEDLNAVAQQKFLPAEQRVVLLAQPEKEGLARPKVADLQAVEARVAAAEIAPYLDTYTDEPLLAELPEPGAVVAEREEEALGFTVWTLSNGAEVWLRPTDFRAHEIEFIAHSIGGLNQVSDADFPAGQTAHDILRKSGLGTFDVPALERRLAGHHLYIAPYLTHTTEGLRGRSTPDDLEIFLQLAWLHFTAPRFDEEAFEQVRQERLEAAANRLSNPRAPYHEAHTRLLWQDFPRYRPWTAETVEQMDLARSEALFRERFADASDFRFVFVGDFEPEALRPLVGRYVAALPALGHAEEMRDLGARRVSGRHEQTIYSGTEPQADVNIVLHGPYTSTFEERNRLAGLNEIASIRLREVLREELGGVYGVSVRLGAESWPEQRYTASISFTCDPDRVEELEQATFAVLDELMREPVDAHYIETYKNKSLRSREESERTNSFWTGLPAGTLDLVRLTGEDLVEVLDYEARVRSLTPELLQQTAQAVLAAENIVISRRLPASFSPED